MVVSCVGIICDMIWYNSWYNMDSWVNGVYSGGVNGCLLV